MKKITDYLHLYLGAHAYWQEHGTKSTYARKIDYEMLKHADWIKPILRPLSDMAVQEMLKYVMILFTHKDIKIDSDEIDIEMFHNDGGNMVDGDVEVGANISCRCYEGQIAIRKCGSTHLFDEAGNPENVYNLPEGMKYLLSKHFDLFNLIPEGLAIDKTTLNIHEQTNAKSLKFNEKP